MKIIKWLFPKTKDVIVLSARDTRDLIFNLTLDKDKIYCLYMNENSVGYLRQMNYGWQFSLDGMLWTGNPIKFNKIITRLEEKRKENNN